MKLLSLHRGQDQGFFRRNVPGAIAIHLLAAVLFFPGMMLHAADQNEGVDKILRMNGITFHVLCPNQGSLNTLTIIPAGLENDNAEIKKEVDGSVTGVEVADLNGDGSPEIYVYINSAGSGSYGSLVAFSSNNKKSLSEIFLPPLEDAPEKAKGYMGHDQFKVVKGNLTRRFPIYNNGDSNANPTGGIRSLEYKLIAGEAGWRLELIKNSTR